LLSHCGSLPAAGGFELQQAGIAAGLELKQINPLQ
jgi:hypothetical protein